MRKTYFVSILAAAAFALRAITLLAHADSSSGTFVVTAGSLSESIGAIPTISAQLNGQDINTNLTLPVTIIDATGSGGGWNITVSETAFTGTVNSTPVTLTVDPQVASDTTACGGSSTCTLPTNSVSYPLTIPLASSPAAKLINAAVNTGLGTISTTGTLNITIPANTKVATYSSTITVSAVSGL